MKKSKKQKQETIAASQQILNDISPWCKENGFTAIVISHGDGVKTKDDLKNIKKLLSEI